MTDKEDIQFPINHALLEEASKIKQERRLIRERIEKIDASKSEVSPKIYQKVREDYVAKFNEITAALLEKKTDIDRELATLYETRSKVTSNLEQHKERLEEIKFRRQIGEYDNETFQKEGDEESSKIGKFEKILSAVNSNIERYEAIFAGEEGLAETATPSLSKRKVPPSLEKTPPLGTVEKDTSDYLLGPEEEGYFAPEKDVHEAPTAGSVSETTKKAPPVGAARLIAIEGPHTGQDFKLKKEITIGRANTNMIVLKDAKVSRQHAVIRQTGKEFIVLDLNSSNGIFVNHERVKEHVLGDGDQIQIGDSVFQFKL